MFFRKKKKWIPPEPDFSKVRLFRGDYYSPYMPEISDHHTYSLLEWAEDSDFDFPELAIDCVVAVLEDFPVVVNRLFPRFFKETVRNDEEIEAYLKSIEYVEFGWESDVVTITNGPDRNLIACFPHDNEFYQAEFSGYRQFETDKTSNGAPYRPDVTLYFTHLHDRLVISVPKGESVVDLYGQTIAEVCRKYGKTLVIDENIWIANNME